VTGSWCDLEVASCVRAAYKQQRDCYGRTEVRESGFDCYGDYNERLSDISTHGASVSTRAVTVSICRFQT